ncbi:KpsF/GutQ family sugar-phosphate isomerase [Aliikangiella marina]|uniref:Arabinose 5-phosphate isomerase n=1 Tax=Aliikangiella marina TaxID=1712262 RepID=A0A545T6Q8_9GAMM|nr:KpsF/GutQ family sugar-phosphate isomerase [Aliikangiella marina]TQV72868.1 KpsF/GutQ family sugar-phosphate isomerase [Aliikangiella marina]
MSQAEDFVKNGIQVIEVEKAAVAALQKSIDKNFADACQLLFNCQGRIVVIGMGKSGHIGNKIAATLASTGSPAFFVHPGEASHGDLGMITADDVVLALSNSGETAEVTSLLPVIKRLNVPLISMTGNPKSTLSKFANVNLDTSVDKEACPMNLAPTASTTVALVMGDALAVALLQARGFTEDDFALSHPGGSLGRKLLLKVEDIMHHGELMPLVSETTSLTNSLLEMTEKRLGMTCVVNAEGKLIGIFTDGDLRRTLAKGLDFSSTPINQVMTHSPKTINAGKLAAEALQLMETHAINALVVVDEVEKPIGALNMHDLLKAGVV